MQNRAQNIFELAEEMKRREKRPLISSKLMEVNKRCFKCDEFYVYWDKDDCEEDEEGFHYMCPNQTYAGDYCGTRLTFNPKKSMI